MERPNRRRDPAVPIHTCGPGFAIARRQTRVVALEISGFLRLACNMTCCCQTLLQWTHRTLAIVQRPHNKNLPSAALIVAGNKLFRRDRPDTKGRGVRIYMKESIQCNEIKWPNGNELEYIGLNVTLSLEMSFMLVALYRPPSTKVYSYGRV